MTAVHVLLVLVAAMCTADVLMATATDAEHARVHGRFFQLGLLHNTDKVTGHRYALLYDHYLPRYLYKPTVKLMEVGLGCGMAYGTGHSVPVWRDYFKSTNLDLFVAEYDERCAKEWAQLHPGQAKVLIGSQVNETTLEEWAAESGGQFDVIVDDAGHSWRGQTLTFRHLWKAVAPGGIYVIEDLQCSTMESLSDKDLTLDPRTWISGMIVALFTSATPPLPGLKSINCFPEACVFTKCGLKDNGINGPECG